MVGPNPHLTLRWQERTTGMAALIARHRWASTSVGVLRNWPPVLQASVSMILNCDSPMAIAWGREGALLYNDAYREILKDKHPAALGIPAQQVFHEAWTQISTLFDAVWAGEPVSVDDVNIPLRRQGKLSAAFFSFSYSPLVDEQGEIQGVLAVVLETTTRNRREQEISNIFEATLSATADFACVFDAEGKFTYANRPYTELMGFSREQLEGKRYADLGLPTALANKLTRQLLEAFTTRKSVRDETFFAGANGQTGYFDYIFNPAVGPDGIVSAVVCTTRDVTELKQARNGFEAARDAAEEANHAKDDFLAALSHELRTPLNPILLLATEGANDQALLETTRRDFALISKNIELEARLIDDLLDLTKITRGKMALSLGVADVHDVLRDALTNVRSDLAEKQITLAENFLAERSVVRGDTVRLQQVFWNILRNAAKFTPTDGAVSITTSCLDGRIVVRITDNGLGLTEGELANLFNAFVQGEHGAKGGSHRFGGLGLGLAISRMLVELHSGTITAASQGRHCGATFSVSIPLSVESLVIPAAMARTDAGSSRPAGKALKILLVEDHEPTRIALRQLLRIRHHEVSEAGTVAAALKLAEERTYDLLLTDIGLPDGDGFEILVACQVKYRVPGMVLSVYGMEQDIKQSKEKGALAHLTKPIQIQALDAALRIAADRK